MRLKNTFSSFSLGVVEDSFSSFVVTASVSFSAVGGSLLSDKILLKSASSRMDDDFWGSSSMVSKQDSSKIVSVVLVSVEVS